MAKAVNQCVTLTQKNVSLFGRIKTVVWNFILPPHIKLVATKEDK